jgi:hypothetical protein
VEHGLCDRFLWAMGDRFIAEFGCTGRMTYKLRALVFGFPDAWWCVRRGASSKLKKPRSFSDRGFFRLYSSAFRLYPLPFHFPKKQIIF